jgi:hypothetical protein
LGNARGARGVAGRFTFTLARDFDFALALAFGFASAFARVVVLAPDFLLFAMPVSRMDSPRPQQQLCRASGWAQ